VTPDDVKMFFNEALSHRIILKMEYEVDREVTPSKVLERVASKVEVPKDYRKGA
jgi:MoxR-like ATPase